MNRNELRAILNAESIRPDYYELEGDAFAEQFVTGRDEKLTIRKEGEEWLVYYFERGQRTEERRFNTETEACEEVLASLRRDPGAKKR